MIDSLNPSALEAVFCLEYEVITQSTNAKSLLGDVDIEYPTTLSVFAKKSVSNVTAFTKQSTEKSTLLVLALQYSICEDPLTACTAIPLVTVELNLLSGYATEFHKNGSAPESVCVNVAADTSATYVGEELAQGLVADGNVICLQMNVMFAVQIPLSRLTVQEVGLQPYIAV